MVKIASLTKLATMDTYKAMVLALHGTVQRRCGESSGLEIILVFGCCIKRLTYTRFDRYTTVMGLRLVLV